MKNAYKNPVKKLYPPRSCSYSTDECNFEDECACNSFGREMPVKINRIHKKSKLVPASIMVGVGTIIANYTIVPVILNAYGI